MGFSERIDTILNSAKLENTHTRTHVSTCKHTHTQMQTRARTHTRTHTYAHNVHVHYVKCIFRFSLNWRGQLSGQSAGLIIKRSRVRIPAGAAGEFSSPASTFCADSYFGIRSTSVLTQQHVKDPGHSAKSAGCRLQLNTHAPYVCGFA